MSLSIHLRSDLTGRIIGMLVFLIGVGLLCTVFSMAYKLFNASPAAALEGIRITGNAKTDSSAAAIGAQFGVLLLKIVYLFIMSVAGSLIAQSGIKLYFSAMKGPAPEVLSHHVTSPVQPGQ